MIILATFSLHIYYDNTNPQFKVLTIYSSNLLSLILFYPLFYLFPNFYETFCVQIFNFP